MRQILISKGSEVLVREVPSPQPGPGEVLIDVHHSLISTGTETHALASKSLSARLASAVELARLGAERLRSAGLEETLRKARVRDGIRDATGYSVSGVVREVGDAVNDLRPGDRVAAAGSEYAHHAEQVAVPRNLVVPVPLGMSTRHACFGTVGSIALQGVRRARPEVGETVAVIGLGLVGQLAAQILAASGCRVIGVDPRQDRRDLAASSAGLLATCSPDSDEVEARVLAETGGVGVDAVLLCAGTPSSDPANLALRITRQRGRVVVVGAVGMDLERGAFYRKELEFTISCSYGPGRYDPTYEEGGLDYPVGFVRWTENRNMMAFLELAAAGKLALEPLIVDEADLDAAPDAFARAKAGRDAGVGYLLRYGESPGAIVRTTRQPIATQAEGKIGLALIGVGGFATGTLMPALGRIPDFELRAVASRTGVSAARVAEEFRAGIASTDPDEVLADPAIDAVVIATRHDSHADLAERALRAGKHVFSEKPVAIEADSLERLAECARASDRVYTVGTNRRYAPLVADVTNALAAHPGPATLLYRVNAGPVPSGHWTVDPRVGGGRVVGEACHMLDLMLFWLGPEVVSWGAGGLVPVGPGEASPQDFSVSLRLSDADGQEHLASLLYVSSGDAGLGKERIEIHRGGSSLVLDDFRTLEVFGGRAQARSLRAPDKGHDAQMKAFADAIRGRPSPLLGIEEAYRAAKLALAIDHALRTGGA